MLRAVRLVSANPIWQFEDKNNQRLALEQAQNKQRSGAEKRAKQREVGFVLYG